MSTTARAGAGAALAAAACLLLVVAAAATLPASPWHALGAVAAHGVHLVAAFAGGRALVRLARAAPRGALDLVVTCTSAGLAFLALGTLLLATLGWLGPWTPWAVDALAVLAGARGLRSTIARVTEPWRMSDLAVLVSSRLPLVVSLTLVVLLHVAVPFLPLTDATGAPDLALAAQAELRGELPAALGALPGEWATPSQALALHGMASTGQVGARLFSLTCVLLLVAAAWLHAERHLGGRAGDWTALALASAPALLVLGASSPSSAFLALFGMLAFHEAADWFQHATGGKIALASGYGGLLVAESAQGAAIFASVLVLLFLVQALIDRHGVFRQVPGLLGMAAVAAAVALPFVGLAVAADRTDPLGSLAERWTPRSATEGWEPLAESLPDSPAAMVAPLLESLAGLALGVGPLLLGLLLLVALVPDPPDPVRHAVIAVLLGLACLLAPPPYRTALGALGPAAVAAGAAGVAQLARGAAPAAATAAFAAVALPISLALGLVRGPDVGTSLAVMLGRTPADVLRPDDAVVADATASLTLAEGRGAALLGDFGIAFHGVPVHVPRDAAALLSLHDHGALGAIVADVATAPDWARPVLEGPLVREPLGGGRYLVLAPEAALLVRPARPERTVPAAEDAEKAAAPAPAEPEKPAPPPPRKRR